MRNVLLVANWDSNVGYAWWLMESFWVEIASHYSKQGSAIYLIYPSISKIPKAIEESCIITKKISFRSSNSSEIETLRNFIKTSDIGLVYLSDQPSTSILYAKLRFWGIDKIVIHDHSPGEREVPKGIKRIFKSVVHRIPLIAADLYIGATEYIQERNINVNQLSRNKTAAAPNGIVPIEIDLRNRAKYRDEFGFSNDAIVFVSTGRAHIYKGIDFLLHCASKLIKGSTTEMYFIHCGDGPHLEKFKELALELGISKRFLFLGRRNDVREILQACDIAIHAAKGEVGYSLSILEYMSANLATFVPDRESVCQSIKHNKTGIIYKADSQSDLCQKVIELINDPDKRSLLAKSACEEVKRNYTLDLTKQALIRAISKVF